MNIKKSIIFAASFLLMFSCSKSDRFKIDTEKIDLNLKIERFDRDLMSMNTADMPKSIAEMQGKYGEFFTFYCTRIMPKIGNPDSAAAAENLKAFLADSMVREVYEETQTVFADVSGIEKELRNAFKYVKYYFPDRKIPRFLLHISGFWNSIETTPNYNFISISADCYLGADYAPYRQLEGIYDYQLPSMSPEKVAPDFLMGYLINEFGVGDGRNLLEAIIGRGKIYYLQSVFMPQRTEDDLMGYTPEQLEWCRKNEKAMWGYLLEHKQLYETTHMTLVKYLNPAPFTTFFTQESPGQAALWLGWQIVKSYMDANPDVSLNDLMKENNAQRILELSKYKP